MEKFTVLTKIRSLSMQEISEDERIEGIRELLAQLPEEKPKRKEKGSKNRLETGGEDREG